MTSAEGGRGATGDELDALEAALLAELGAPCPLPSQAVPPGACLVVTATGVSGHATAAEPSAEVLEALAHLLLQRGTPPAVRIARMRSLLEGQPTLPGCAAARSAQRVDAAHAHDMAAAPLALCGQAAGGAALGGASALAANGSSGSQSPLQPSSGAQLSSSKSHASLESSCIQQVAMQPQQAAWRQVSWPQQQVVVQPRQVAMLVMQPQQQAALQPQQQQQVAVQGQHQQWLQQQPAAQGQQQQWPLQQPAVQDQQQQWLQQQALPPEPQQQALLPERQQQAVKQLKLKQQTVKQEAVKQEAVKQEALVRLHSLSCSASPAVEDHRRARRRYEQRRRSRVADMEAQVAALEAQLTSLAATKQQLLAREASLEDVLAQMERLVAGMLELKHNADKQPEASAQQQPRVGQAWCGGGTLPAPGVGYAPDVWRQPTIPTVAGPMQSPGKSPMFEPVPQSEVAKGAKIFSRFVQDVQAVIASASACSLSDLPQEQQELLRARCTFIQANARRYHFLNPVFLYQLRAVNLATLAPDVPPPGHWRSVGALMAALLSDRERQQLRVAQRLFKASLRAISKEHHSLQQQLLTTSRRLQLQQPSSSTLQGSDSSSCCSSSPPLEQPLASEAALLEQLQLQQALDEQLQQLERLLLREHDQHFMLLWSAAKIPKVDVYMQVLLASYPFVPNMHEIVEHAVELGG